MEGGGDAVCEQRPVRIAQREIDIEGHAGAGHDVAFEGVAMAIDDAGQHQQAGGIEAQSARPRDSADRRYQRSVCDDVERGEAIRQHPAPGNMKCHSRLRRHRERRVWDAIMTMR
jgi:hypothetical protein